MNTSDGTQILPLVIVRAIYTLQHIACHDIIIFCMFVVLENGDVQRADKVAVVGVGAPASASRSRSQFTVYLGESFAQVMRIKRLD